MEPDANCPDRAREGVQHLQAAARELIQAARALLDVAEDLIDDPAAIGTLVGALGAMGDAARRRTATPADGHREGAAEASPEPTIERITVA